MISTISYSNPKHDFLAPYSPVGLVVSNGKLSSEMINSGLSNPTPYYALADGIYRDALNVVKRGEVVFQSLDLRVASYSSSCSSDPFFIERENATMKGITIANGQGDGALSNYDFMNSIQVLGIVEMDNSCGQDRFNILSDGIVDVRNNGNETITVGDTVVVYFPTREEVRQRANLKNPHKDEAAGVVKAWLRPYRPELHALTTKGLYLCLQDKENSKGYLPPYRRVCHQFLDSAIGMAMVMFARILPDIRQVLSGAPVSDAEVLTLMMGLLGHTEFRDLPGGVSGRRRDELIDSLFVPFSATSRNATEYLYPLQADGLSKRERDLRAHLTEIQQKSTSLALENLVQFAQQMQNLIIGRAKSTARPNFDFSLKIDK